MPIKNVNIPLLLIIVYFLELLECLLLVASIHACCFPLLTNSMVLAINRRKLTFFSFFAQIEKSVTHHYSQLLPPCSLLKQHNNNILSVLQTCLSIKVCLWQAESCKQQQSSSYQYIREGIGLLHGNSQSHCPLTCVEFWGQSSSTPESCCLEPLLLLLFPAILLLRR